MPLVRSANDIPAQVEQEVADRDNWGAGGDADTPLSRLNRPRTRLQARIAASEQRSADNRVRQLVNESLRDFRDEIGNMITETFRNLSLGSLRQNTQDRQNERVDNDDMENHRPSTQNRLLDRENDRPNNTHNDNNTEKTLNIIRNWKVRFTGDISEISVDEFIYRVDTLTYANLRGNFQLLCEHAHILFEGKALKWFWRFHRSCENMNWADLREAMKRQYKDYHTDFDIKDEILRRKQKPKELFDEFYDSIIVLCDRLRTPLSDYELCEMMQRNLRSEVRHELLHLDITSVAQLRRAVRKHEKFVLDMTASNSTKRSFEKGRVSEVRSDRTSIELENDFDENLEVCLVVQKGKCWNCDKSGHSFVECMEPRSIFCYGCGTKNIFKPQCPNCLQKRGNALRDVRLRKDGHPI